MPRRISPLWIAALLLLGSVSCLRKLEPLKVVCSKEKPTCPKGYSCVVPDKAQVGHCQLGNTSGDAGRTDGASDGQSGGNSGSRDGGQDGTQGSAGSGGSSKIDARGGSGGSGPDTSDSSSLATGGSTADTGSGAGGGGISWPDALPPTDAPGAPAGTPCASSSECSSGHCIDDVCCAATECAGCFACANLLTDQPDGTCAPVANGKIAHDACTDETASKPCGNDGTCDGKGACRKAAAGKSCGEGACNANGDYVPAPTCDGKGVCPPGTPQTCAPYPCLATGCDKKCSKQTDCDTGTYCDTTASSCKATKTNGTAATEGYECSSGVVADGVCCNLACTGCSACTAALNGQDSKTTGTCLPVIKGKAAPHNACPKGTDPCGMDGTCDGDAHCNYPVLGSECGTKSCAATTSMLTKGTCDSSHACKQATASCPGAMACLATGADCRPGPCTVEADCASGNYCTSTGTCASKSGAGSLCTPATASQCSNGACVDGHCCSLALCGTCQSCTGTSGTCVAVTNAEDPDTCSGTKACDITGTCKKKTGQACTPGAGTECLSGYCADGVCCDRACTGSCEYCNNAGAAGQCAYITGAPRTGHTACAGDSTACAGTCKGGKADCDLPGSETVCRQPSCQTTTSQIDQALCRGTGTCPAQSTTSCGMYTCSSGACLSLCTGGGQCSSGACINGSCQSCGSYSSCGTYCADLTSDASNCGTCGYICPTAKKYCSARNCVACTSDAQCIAAGYPNGSCLNGTCACRQKNINNKVPNPGFDSTVSPWVLRNQAAYVPSADADSCSASGSITMQNFMDGVSVCFQMPASTYFTAGFRYRGTASCTLYTYADSQCAGNSLSSVDLTDFGTTYPTWTSLGGARSGTTPATTVAAEINCAVSAGNADYDQFYVNVAGGTF